LSITRGPEEDFERPLEEEERLEVLFFFLEDDLFFFFEEDELLLLFFLSLENGLVPVTSFPDADITLGFIVILPYLLFCVFFRYLVYFYNILDRLDHKQRVAYKRGQPAHYFD
jgi:hypothetical protein